MNNYSLLLTRHAANDYEGWVKIMKPFKLSHKPTVRVSVERVRAYNKQLRNSTINECRESKERAIVSTRERERERTIWIPISKPSYKPH